MRIGERDFLRVHTWYSLQPKTKEQPQEEQPGAEEAPQIQTEIGMEVPSCTFLLLLHFLPNGIWLSHCKLNHKVVRKLDGSDITLFRH
jgi:hypothetical protein